MIIGILTTIHGVKNHTDRLRQRAVKATADYGIGPTVASISADQAAAAITTARRFIDTITQLLPPGLTPPRGPSTQP
jgi:hypothetical protein